ncbi:AMP-binding protein [uncultured Sulfitobacter sp.]|uniref:class I adenylate-forming enzyme family protein n=1 Tax=uncultured Sulfitobacter sp. TaxID=191468 RepID=UPI002605DA6C|nr:AMP-binding protein [uncultured Sulfitobacter sp.]
MVNSSSYPDRPSTEKAPAARPPGQRDANVPALLARQAVGHSDKLALSAVSGGSRRVCLTYRQLHDECQAAAGVLREAGLKAGDRLGIYLTNEWGIECFVGALGALALGAVVVPFNTRAAAGELRHAVELTEPRFIVAERDGQRHLAQALEEVAPPFLDPIYCNVAPGTSGVAQCDIASDALGCLLFTSGTTARAKAVMHSHATMLATGVTTGGALGLRAGDIYQGAFPFFTSSALNLAGMSCWVAGAGLVVEGQVDNEGRLALIEKAKTTFYHGVPSILNFMMQTYSPERHDMGRLRTVAAGGAALAQELSDRITRNWPWVEQMQIYGMTESGPAGTVLDPDMRSLKAGSVGRAMNGMELEVLDDAGQPVPPGEMGEIALTGPSVALGYYRNPEATQAAFSGRIILTGDVGQVDDHGYLFFGDRKKDLINRGGLKIASVGVENVLYQHPGVSEAAVIAIPHRDLGEDIAACIVAMPGAEPSEAELIAHCRTVLADYQIPRHIRFYDSLPKNPLGKIVKTELRARWQAGPS